MMWRKEVADSVLFKLVIVAAMLLLFISIYFNKTLLFLVAILLFTIYWAGNYYEKWIDMQLNLDNRKDTVKLFPGESGHMKLDIAQKGWLPIIGGKLSITIDHLVEMKNEPTNVRSTGTDLSFPVNLMRNETASYMLEFNAKSRGIAKIRTLAIYLPNPFGKNGIHLTLDHFYRTEVMVFPKPLHVSGWERIVPVRNGFQRSNWSLYENRNLPVGTRNYVVGDTFNQIHWKASAKHNTLQTKVYEKVTDASILILVDVRNEKGTPGSTLELEELLSSVAFLCQQATKDSLPFAIYFNIRSFGNPPFLHLAKGEGKEQLARAMELLARIDKNALTTSYDAMFMYLKRHISPPAYTIHLGRKPNSNLVERWGSTIYTVDIKEGKAALKPWKLRKGVQGKWPQQNG